ncbi:MAG TPA: AAA family ATPase [Terracidiphilus sp.]|nr:AAA family ATPase [Terracidiphilus sp.]
MRIENVRIKNLRCIKDATVNFDNYTCIVGPNGAGKSTVLIALNIFFRQTEDSPTDVAYLTAEDFCKQDTSEPVEITVTFSDLSPEAIEDFKEYVRQGKLIVSVVAKFDPAANRAEVKQFGQRLGMAAFKPFFKAYGDGALADDLKAKFATLEKEIPDIEALKSKKTKDAMYQTLRDFESARPEACEVIPSEDQFYGISKGANRLEKYIQWVYVPAVKDATDEDSETKTGALGKLLARTVRAKVNFAASLDALVSEARQKYQQMLDDNEASLDEISTALKGRISEWAHPDATLRLAWQLDPSKAVKAEPPIAGIIAGESGFEGKLVRLGHGFQRSYLLALLQELAFSDDPSAPKLILGCEEPELYQHPPQLRHLAGVLEKLSDNNAQIVVTTHSPHFVSGKNFESVRLVRRDKDDDSASIRQYTFDDIAKRFAEVVGEPLKTYSAALAKVNQVLQPVLNEMFFTRRLVLVEGLEDLAYIHSWLVLTDRWESFRRSGCHIVPTNGKSEMIRPLLVAQGLRMPTFSIFDADGDKVGDASKRTRHHRDNVALLRLIGGDENDPFPTGPVWGGSYAIWPSDLGDNVEREFIVSLGIQGNLKFEALKGQANAECGFAGDLGKNVVYIGKLLGLLQEAGAKSPTLDRLCDEIIAFGG